MSARASATRWDSPPERVPGHASALAAITAALAADAIGINILITGITASVALAAAMAGLSAIAAGTVALGVIGDALYLHGTAQWAALMIYGIGLIAIAGIGHLTTGHAG